MLRDLPPMGCSAPAVVFEVYDGRTAQGLAVVEPRVLEGDKADL
jgi:hypothetical protein